MREQHSAEAQVASARAALSSAEHQVDAFQSDRAARTMLDYARITAPFSGMITKRYTDAGAMIQAGTASQSQTMPLVRLAEIARLRLVVPVPESRCRTSPPGPRWRSRYSLNRNVRGMSPASPATCRCPPAPWMSKWTSPTPTASSARHVCRRRLTLEKRDNARTIPVQALVTREGKRFVMVVKRTTRSKSARPDRHRNGGEARSGHRRRNRRACHCQQQGPAQAGPASGTENWRSTQQ